MATDQVRAGGVGFDPQRPAPRRLQDERLLGEWAEHRAKLNVRGGGIARRRGGRSGGLGTVNRPLLAGQVARVDRVDIEVVEAEAAVCDLFGTHGAGGYLGRGDACQPASETVERARDDRTLR